MFTGLCEVLILWRPWKALTDRDAVTEVGEEAAGVLGVVAIAAVVLPVESERAEAPKFPEPDAPIDEAAKFPEADGTRYG